MACALYAFRHRYQLARFGFEFDPHKPVVVKSLGTEPSLYCITVRRFEFQQHFALKHIYLDAPHCDADPCREPFRELFGALAG